MRFRLFQPDDLASLSTICLRTGNHGGDASGCCTHPELLGDYFAVPYAGYDPNLCLILDAEDGTRACGYILGVADTRAFVGWFNREWLPRLREKYLTVTAPENACDAWLLRALQNDAPVPAWADQYPAHLHIDLLERAQGQGWGRELVHAWLDLVAARGVRGMHLGVSKANSRAIAFYESLGLQRICEDGAAWIFALDLQEARGGA
jgi:ribosomal protein S18 acetylase RimI-like enzyme